MTEQGLIIYIYCIYNPRKTEESLFNMQTGFFASWGRHQGGNKEHRLVTNYADPIMTTKEKKRSEPKSLLMKSRGTCAKCANIQPSSELRICDVIN